MDVTLCVAATVVSGRFCTGERDPGLCALPPTSPEAHAPGRHAVRCHHYNLMPIVLYIGVGAKHLSDNHEAADG